MPRTSAAIGSDPIMTAAAEDALSRSASAVDACLAGWFAAAGAYRGVCLGSVVMLVAGTGSGNHLFNGSVLQPGLGAPRPRGFIRDCEVPQAAAVAVPTVGSWLVATHAHAGSLSLTELAAAGMKLARENKSPQRANFLKRLAQAGPLALRESPFIRAYMQIASRAQGGNVTSQDLEQAQANILPATVQQDIICPPQATLHNSCCMAATRRLVILACDNRGLWAALHCTFDDNGVELDGFDITASRFAVPVRRAVPWVRPATPIAHYLPIAIMSHHSVPWIALGWQQVQQPDWTQLRQQLSHDGVVDAQLAQFVSRTTQQQKNARLLACAKGTAMDDGARVFDIC